MAKFILEIADKDSRHCGSPSPLYGYWKRDVARRTTFYAIKPFHRLFRCISFMIWLGVFALWDTYLESELTFRPTELLKRLEFLNWWL